MYKYITSFTLGGFMSTKLQPASTYKNIISFFLLVFLFKCLLKHYLLQTLEHCLLFFFYLSFFFIHISFGFICTKRNWMKGIAEKKGQSKDEQLWITIIMKKKKWNVFNKRNIYLRIKPLENCKKYLEKEKTNSFLLCVCVGCC